MIKKALITIPKYILLSALILLLAACGGKSQNAKLGMKAMNEGDYDRAKRLYNFAVEKGEADAEDKKIYDILCAYTDAQKSLKAEEFEQGLAIIDSCVYDYSALAIRSDMDRLYNQLSDGKYADERLRSLSEVTESGNLERARGMITEINRLNLTSSQQERLEALSQEVARQLITENPNDEVIYYANKPADETIPLYSDAAEESDVLLEIPGMQPIEVKSFADNGFISVIYDNTAGYVKLADIVSSMPTYQEKPADSDNGDEKEDKESDKESGEKTVADGKEEKTDKDSDGKDGESTGGKDDGKNLDKNDTSPVVEATSAGDVLKAITNVNLRKEPNTDCEILDVVKSGDEVTYLGQMEDGFYKVSYNGDTGYVYSDYLKK